MSAAQPASRAPAATPSTPPGQRKSVKPMSVLSAKGTPPPCCVLCSLCAFCSVCFCSAISWFCVLWTVLCSEL